MSTNTFAIGDRVMLIPFQHKGKIATVKYFGAIGKKFGTWVGLELDEPTGDSSGDVNGEQLFDCKEMHGLVLRNTQVRHYDPTAPVVAKTVPSAVAASTTGTTSGGSFLGTSGGTLTLDSDLSAHLEQKLQGLSGSPLLTPTASFVNASLTESSNKLLQKVNESLSNITGGSFIEETKAADNKKKGWHERLERLKLKKAEDKKIQETNAGTDLDNEAADIRSSFAPVAGIKKDAKGNLVVDKAEVKTSDKIDGEKLLIQIEKRDLLAAQKAAEPEPESPKPTPEVKKTVAATPVKPGHNRMVSNADKIKEKQAALQQEKLDRTQRQTGTGLAKPGATSKTGATSAAKSSLNQSINSSASKSNLNQSLNTSKTGGSAIKSSGLNSTLRTAAKDKAEEAKVPGLARQNSSSRLGGVTAREPTTPGLRRENSSSRLGLADRPGTSTGVRPSSNARAGASNLRAGGRDGAQSARGVSKDKIMVGSTLVKKVGEALNSTIRNNRTPVTTRPGGASPQTALAAKGLTRVGSTATIGAGKAPTPMDYKKMEAMVNDKTTEIQCLQEEVKGLNDRIIEIKETHSAELDTLDEQHKAVVKKASEKHAEEKVSFQNELESITERMMNASPNDGAQTQEIMERAHEQLTQIKADQSSSLQAEHEKFQNLMGELQELKVEQEQKNAQIEELKDQVQVLTGQLSEQNTQHASEIQNLNERLESMQNQQPLQDEGAQQAQQEMIEKHGELTQQLETKLSEYQKQAEMQKQQAIESRDLQIKDLTKKTMDQITAYTELETQRAEESELFNLELEQAKDEKEEILQQLMTAGKVDDEDPLQDIGLEEIKIQNKKLRTAITSLTFGFEEERKRLATALKDETSKDKKIAELEDKIKDMEFLIDEVEMKEQERADMQEKLEEIVEYENMVEEMVQEIAKQEEVNDEMQGRLAECQEEQRLMEDLNNQLEQYNKELTNEIEGKDDKIVQYKAEIEQLEVIVVEQDGLGDKYKDRVSELQKQIKIMGDQLQEYTQDGSKDQLGILLERQQTMVRQLREAESKQLQVQRNLVELWQGRTYSELVVQILPVGLQKEAQLDAYTKVQQLNTLRHKATLFVREICDKQLEQASTIYEEKDQLDSYVTLLQKLGHLMSSIIHACALIQFQMANSTPEQYREMTRVTTWDRIPVIMSQVDTITDLMNNQSLSYTFETNDFATELKSLETLVTKIEKLFSALSPEESKQAEIEQVNPEKMKQSIAYQRRQNLIEHVGKLKLRTAAFQMALGVCFVSFYSKDQQEGRAVSQKCKLIYLRLLDTIMKIDHIPNEEDGSDYIDTRQLNTDLRLQQKLDDIAVLWSGSSADISEQRQKSWLSTLEAIERDITMLNNDFKFKRLIKLVDQKYGSQKIDFNDLYKLDFQASGPWRQIATNIKTELQDMTVLKQKNTQLQEKQKESLIQTITLKKEKDEAVLITKNLDSKLSTALAKAEQVPALEIEKRDLEKKLTSVAKQLELRGADAEKNAKAVTDLTKRLEEAKKIQAAAPPPELQQQQAQVAGGTGRPNIKARQMASKHSSRQSRAQNYFATLQMSGGFNKTNDPSAGHNRNASQYNTTQMMQQLQITEDVYMQIIAELQYDRLKLKAKDMTQRVARLSAEGSSFSSLLKSFGQVEVRLNQDESNLVQGAIKEVSKLRHGLKKRMAQARVIDFSKKDIADANSSQEQFNQQVIKAKDIVNETLDLLFSKDTKFKPDSSATEKKVQVKEEGKPTTGNLSEIKIGEIKLRGKVQLPTRKVILDQTQLGDMRRNLALFSC